MTIPSTEKANTHMLSTRDIAHRLHENGFHPFPLDHPHHRECIGSHTKIKCDGTRGKHPRVAWTAWAIAATPPMIDMQWAKCGGILNIGVSCGPAGLVVLDEDQPGELQRWCDAYGIELPATYTVTTGRGQHFYFAWDHSVQPITNRETAMTGFKIDVRGHGGMVVAEGSTHASGAVYTGNGLPVAPLPKQVAAILLAEHAAAQPNTNMNNPENFFDEKHDPNTTKIAMGERHNALVAYAGRLRSKGMDWAEAEHLFKQRWLLCEQPEGKIPEALHHSPDCPYPVTWPEALEKLTDIYGRYPAGEPEAVGNSHTSDGASANRILMWRSGTDVKDGVPEWAWEYDGQGAMMRNTLALLAGRPEAGKSTAARWFAAGYTKGTIPGCFEDEPQDVAYIAAEESLEYMVKPSLRAVGADMERIHFPHVEMNGEQVQLLSSQDEDIITEGLIARGITVVVIDPIMAGISGEVDINRNNEVRLAVQPWARIADRINGLCIGIVHLKKAPGGDVVAAINGSSAFGEIARAIIAFAPDDESEDGAHIMSQVKNSNGPGKPSISYTIEDTIVETDGGTAHVGRFVMGERSDRTVSDVLSQTTTKAKLGTRMIEVLTAVATAPPHIPVTPQYISDTLTDMSAKDAAKYLARAVKHDLLVKRTRGVYGLPG